MKTLITSFLFTIILSLTTICVAADVTLNWDESTGATGYKIYISTDMGATWDVGTDVGNVTTYNYTGVPDTGLVIFRVGVYNDVGEYIRHESGAWFNGSWSLPVPAGGLNVGSTSLLDF